MLSMPSAYIQGYEKAHVCDQALADNYIRHTWLGDPELDPIMEELADLPAHSMHRFIKAGIEGPDEILSTAPESLRNFFLEWKEPEWLDYDVFEPGIRSFNTNVDLMLAAFVTGVLVEGFSTLIAKSFHMTGRVAANDRRLRQNNRQLMEIFFPEGLRKNGDGWKLSMRIRFVHARVRQLLGKSEDWNREAWGVPLSAANLGLAISIFSMQLLKYAQLLGARFNQQEKDGVLAIWRYAGYVMGIPESILYIDGKNAEQIYNIGYMCEPEPGKESIAMANLLINSVPDIAGVSDPKEEEQLITLAYRLSTVLIGRNLAKQFQYPQYSWWCLFRTHWGFRIKQQLHRLFRGTQLVKSENFLQLLTMSVYDTTGISYHMPDHVQASKSKPW